MSRSESQPRIGVGIPSVLMVLVVLAMAALCMLSYSSATSTESMTQRNVDVASGYYRLSAEVQERLAQLDEQLAANQGDYSAVTVDGVQFSSEEGKDPSFLLTVREGEKSIVAEGILTPDQPLRYRVLAYYTQNMSAEEEAPYLELMGGQD